MAVRQGCGPKSYPVEGVRYIASRVFDRLRRGHGSQNRAIGGNEEHELATEQLRHEEERKRSQKAHELACYKHTILCLIKQVYYVR